MKISLLATGFGLALLGAIVTTAGSALASGSDDRRGHGSERVVREAPTVFYGYPPRHGGRDSYRPRGNQRDVGRQYNGRGHNYAAKRHAYRSKRAYTNVVRPCRRTSKIGFVEHGRRARIGGVMCYDTAGIPYIVPGSRFIIQFY